MADDYDYDEEDWGDDYDEGFGDEDEGEEDAGEEEEDEFEDGLEVAELKGEAALVGLHGATRQQNCGIHTIELYYPQFYLDHLELEEYDARPDRYGPSVIGKYVKGIGMTECRLPADDEDPVSFAMTVVHRLCDRIDKDGFNETSRYTKDGKPLPIWNAIGRLDIGSESLIDRSKSMKSYCMDIFERYGQESNIEGVDMYNACYGGQAAGLANLSWVESDRWDGRYGVAVATDISDVPNIALFCGGSSAAATLFFPDAPLTHHSLRASCILHRFDFHKPVGWHSMGPVTDGKYSVNAYMEGVEVCHMTLIKKMNGQSIAKNCDYNIFHTGGGYHIVKKAYERMLRGDDPKMPNAEKNLMVQQKLMPGVHILKIIGPTHTVSSFCNMSSTIMSEWERALGKVMVIFTYGSGSACTMYQTRFDDVPWMKPYAEWVIDFYREAIKCTPWLLGSLQDAYCEVWMKFDYIPYSRTANQIDPWLYQQDAYYLMEIDPWGRRFYHRGGIVAGPRDPSLAVQADFDESRRERKHWGPIPAKSEKKKGGKQLEDAWLKIEEELLLQLDPPAKKLLQVGNDRVNPQHEIVCTELQPSAAIALAKKDESDHTYQIVGTWSEWREPQVMTQSDGQTFSCEITVGENGWEAFYILQDSDFDKKIFPAHPRSWKSLPCVGPHKGKDGYHWLLEARDHPQTPLEDVGDPGDVYRVTFSWKGASKLVEWAKVEGKTDMFPKGSYYVNVTGKETDFTPMVNEGNGKWSLEVFLQKKSFDFFVARNKDMEQLIYPEVELQDSSGETSYGDPLTDGTSGCPVLGAGPWPTDKKIPRWSIEGNQGDAFKIFFTRNADVPDDMNLVWEKQ